MRELGRGWFVAALIAAVLAGSLVVPVPGWARQAGEGVPSVTPEAPARAESAAEAAGQEMKSGLDSNEGAAPPERATGSGLTAVMAVTLIIWIGLFLYVVRLDRKVRRLEGS